MVETVDTTVALSPSGEIELSTLSIRALVNLFSGYEAAAAAFQAILNMPRSNGHGDCVLELETVRCEAMMDTIAREVSIRRAVSDRDRRDKGEILIRQRLRDNDWAGIGIAFTEAIAGPPH